MTDKHDKDLPKNKAGAHQSKPAAQKLKRPNITMNRQQSVVYNALLDGPKTTFDLRNHYRVMSPAPRVLELRAKGLDIAAIPVEIKEPDGTLHKDVAKYVLRHAEV